MKIGGQIPWNASPICETFKICCLMGGHHIERRFGEPFKGPTIPFGSMVESLPYFCQRPVATASVRQESLTKNVPRFCFTRGVNLEKRTSRSQDIEEMEKIGRI